LPYMVPTVLGGVVSVPTWSLSFLTIRYKGQNNNKIIVNNKNIMINEVHENLFYWIVGLVFWISFQMFL
jgi:hypothetical protein